MQWVNLWKRRRGERRKERKEMVKTTRVYEKTTRRKERNRKSKWVELKRSTANGHKRMAFK